MPQPLRSESAETSSCTLLFVVARHRRDLCASLTRDFSGIPGFRIVIDRRRTDRRREIGTSARLERRRRQRRTRGVDHELVTVGFAIVAVPVATDIAV